MSQNNAPTELKMVDNIPGGEYTNLANISYSKEEFHLLFANILPPSGRIVAKLISSPAHFKRMVAVMTSALSRYEGQFGVIDDSSLPDDKEIGFKQI